MKTNNKIGLGLCAIYLALSGLSLWAAYSAGADFKGQFVINLNAGDKSPQFYSRAWDKPDQSPGWNAAKKIINNINLTIK